MLAKRFEGRLRLAAGEHEEDAIAGCVGVALKRASLAGRAPVVNDLTVAFTMWGFLGEAPDELVEFRRPLFEEVSNPLHYAEQRYVADRVPDDMVLLPPKEAAEAFRSHLNL